MDVQSKIQLKWADDLYVTHKSISFASTTEAYTARKLNSFINIYLSYRRIHNYDCILIFFFSTKKTKFVKSASLLSIVCVCIFSAIYEHVDLIWFGALLMKGDHRKVPIIAKIPVQ